MISLSLSLDRIRERKVAIFLQPQVHYRKIYAYNDWKDTILQLIKWLKSKYKSLQEETQILLCTQVGDASQGERRKQERPRRLRRLDSPSSASAIDILSIKFVGLLPLDSRSRS